MEAWLPRGSLLALAVKAGSIHLESRMKRRYLYPLMYSVPAFILSAIIMVVVTAAIGGALWIFVYGDNPWPSFVELYSPIFMFTVLATVWLVLLSAAFTWGKRQEANPSLNMKHLYLAAGSTVALMLLVFLHQLSVGNIGPRPDVLVPSSGQTDG